jgi:pyruvate formate lyase activating enzyme
VSQTGIIFDIKKYALHDGPGIRTTVFFKGCPLDCWWCHNPEGRCLKPEQFARRAAGGNGDKSPGIKLETIGREVSIPEVMAEVDKDVIFYDQSGGGVTFSGGEPMLQIDFLAGLLEECRRRGIHAVVDTSGYAAPEDFEMVWELVDLFLYDLKCIDDTMHKKYTDVSNDLILENLILLAEKGCRAEIRIPIIPGITDTDENLNAIMDFLSPLRDLRRISLLPYNRFAEDKLTRFEMARRLGSMETPSPAMLESKARRFRDRGFSVKIGG